MRVSVSGIAWDPAEDEAVAAVLARHDVDAIDVAPGKYLPSIPDATDAEVAAVRATWADRGIEITGMQSLLYGTEGLNVFGPDDVQARLVEYLTAVFRVGGGLGAGHLVFGSPRNRDRSGLDDARTRDVATRVFGTLGDRAADHGVVLTLEPNPPAYGANFMTTSLETAEVVRAVDHPSVAMQLDTGAIAMNGEDAAAVVAACADVVGHVHVSEPGLAPVGDSTADHAAIGRAVQDALPGLVACIEMVRPTDRPAPEAIDEALALVTATYGGRAR